MRLSAINAVSMLGVLFSLPAWSYYHVSLNDLPSVSSTRVAVTNFSTVPHYPIDYATSDVLLMGTDQYLFFHIDQQHNLWGTPYKQGKMGKSVQLSVEGLPLQFSAAVVEKGQVGRMVAAVSNQGVLVYLGLTGCTEQKYKLFMYPAGVAQSDVA